MGLFTIPKEIRVLLAEHMIITEAAVFLYGNSKTAHSDAEQRVKKILDVLDLEITDLEIGDPKV